MEIMVYALKKKILSKYAVLYIFVTFEPPTVSGIYCSNYIIVNVVNTVNFCSRAFLAAVKQSALFAEQTWYVKCKLIACYLQLG